MDLDPAEVQPVPREPGRSLNFAEYDVYNSVELVGIIKGADKSYEGIPRSVCPEVVAKKYYPVVLETATTNKKSSCPEQDGVVVMVPESLFDDEKLLKLNSTVHICGYMAPCTMFRLNCMSNRASDRIVHNHLRGMTTVDYTVVVVATRVDFISKEAIELDECDSMVVLKGYIGMHEHHPYYAPTKENIQEHSFFGRPHFPVTFQFMSCIGIPDIDYRFKKSAEHTEYNSRIWPATVLTSAANELGDSVETLPVATEVVIGGRLMPTLKSTKFYPSFFPAVSGNPSVDGALGILVHSIDIIGDLK